MGLSRRHGRIHRPPPQEIRDPEAWSEMPHRRLPDGMRGEQHAYEQISSELLLDGHARLNLATFVTTWMPSMEAKLMAETDDKNMNDQDEYPNAAENQNHFVYIP